MENNIVEMRNIVKIFPPDNAALKRVSVSIKKGEIHAIIGENGAGKSTLMKVMYGLEHANSGEIYLRGKRVQISSPKDAVANGIGMVHQEFMLVGVYTVLENIVLGDEPCSALGVLQLEAAREKLNNILKQFHFDVSLDECVQNLSVAAQQKIEIIKLLYRNVDILILDEPTAVLAPQEVDELFELLEQLRADGKTILFISHKLDEVLKISDTVTVMRRGEHIWTKPNHNLTKNVLSNAMVGREVMLQIDKAPCKCGKVVMEFKDVSIKNPRVLGKMYNNHVSFQIRSGEILGVAGVEGNGQYEMVQALIGAMPIDGGDILFNGKRIANESIRQRRQRISYISQDRKRISSSQTNSLIDNAAMTHHYVADSLCTKHGFLSRNKMKQFCTEIIKKYQVTCKGTYANIGELSGGNQQKIIVGREISLGFQLLVADQPVRGLDIGSIEYIHNRIIDERNNGVAVLLVSADLDELFSLSDRIVVFHNGEIVAERYPTETTKEEIGEFMLGVRSEANG